MTMGEANEAALDEVYGNGYADGYRAAESQLRPRLDRMDDFHREMRQMVRDCEGFGDEPELDTIKAALSRIVS